MRRTYTTLLILLCTSIMSSRPMSMSGWCKTRMPCRASKRKKRTHSFWLRGDVVWPACQSRIAGGTLCSSSVRVSCRHTFVLLYEYLTALLLYYNTVTALPLYSERCVYRFPCFSRACLVHPLPRQEAALQHILDCICTCFVFCSSRAAQVDLCIATVAAVVCTCGLRLRGRRLYLRSSHTEGSHVLVRQQICCFRARLSSGGRGVHGRLIFGAYCRGNGNGMVGSIERRVFSVAVHTVRYDGACACSSRYGMQTSY